MTDVGVQCCLNDSTMAALEAEVAILHKMIKKLRDEVDEYSNKWLAEKSLFLRHQFTCMTESVLLDPVEE